MITPLRDVLDCFFGHKYVRIPSIVTKSFQQVDFDMHSPFQNLSFGLECLQETLGLTTFSHS